jgi:hypothetical protein
MNGFHVRCYIKEKIHLCFDGFEKINFPDLLRDYSFSLTALNRLWLMAHIYQAHCFVDYDTGIALPYDILI